jgi:hypothetical protein
MHIISNYFLIRAVPFVLLCFVAGAGYAQDEVGCERDVDQCQYSTTLVRGLLDTPDGIHTSWLEKRNVRLGDRAAVALLKLYTEQELLEPTRLARALKVIRVAFSSPCNTTISLDKIPKVTVFMLQDLQRQAKDEDAKRQILETIKYVQEASGVKCGSPAGGNDANR